MANTSSPEAAAFEKFLQTRKVLVADPSASSRSGLFQIFKDLGAKTTNLVLVNTFQQAQTAIVADKPHIVVAEYELGKRCGLELLQTQREQRPAETKDCIFIIVTGNTSQTAVARSAEEDIDAYIIKPYTPEAVRKTIMKAAINKIQPPRYNLAIDAGKKLFFEGKLDEAEKEFTGALELDKQPALAHFYIGQVQAARKVLEQAQGSYEKGLAINRIHYKCMVGLYEMLMAQHEHVKAYDVVKRISQYFPANPKRLAEVLRLAIVCGKFEDIEKYYATFINIDERNENLIKYICAALVVCGKYYLSAGNAKSRALDLFKKAAATGAGRGKILKEIICALIDYKLIKEAAPFLARFSPEQFDSDDFLLVRFLVNNSDDAGPFAVDQGHALIAKGIIDERLFSVMIRRLAKGRTSEAAETMATEAGVKLPERKAHFLDVLKKARAVGA